MDVIKYDKEKKKTQEINFSVTTVSRLFNYKKCKAFSYNDELSIFNRFSTM